MTKNELNLLIHKFRSDIDSPYLYANYFFDYDHLDNLHFRYFKKKITIISYLKIIFKILLNFFFIFGAIIIKSNKLEKKKIKLHNKVIIGHKINNQKNDFYFFELVKYFKLNSIKFNLFQINHLSSKSKNIFLINNYMNLNDELKLIIKIISLIKNIKDLLLKSYKQKKIGFL